MRLDSDGQLVESEFLAVAFDGDGICLNYRDCYCHPAKLLEVMAEQVKHISTGSGDVFARTKARLLLKDMRRNIQFFRATKQPELEVK